MAGFTPSEFIKLGLQADKFRRAGYREEWHGPCPKCGGTDRFVIFTDREFPNWNYFCRQCEPGGGWVTDWRPDLREPMPPDVAIKNAAAAIERAEQARDNLEKAIIELRRSQAWLEYNKNRQQNAGAQELWKRAGIPAFFQDYWKLGFQPNRIVWSNGKQYQTPTLTIPIFEPVTWKVLNIRHRLLAPASPGDKYRPERSGLPAAWFVAEPEKTLSGPTFLVEGEKKAMVTFITADSTNIQVIGSPGKNVSDNLINELKDCEPIWIIPDPGSFFDWFDIARKIGLDRVRMIELPQKIDDMIINAGLTKDWLRAMVKNGRKFTGLWLPGVK